MAYLIPSMCMTIWQFTRLVVNAFVVDIQRVLLMILGEPFFIQYLNKLSDPFEACVFEDEGFASHGFELDDDAGVLAWGGFHDHAFSELGVGDGASDGELVAVGT